MLARRAGAAAGFGAAAFLTGFLMSLLAGFLMLPAAGRDAAPLAVLEDAFFLTGGFGRFAAFRTPLAEALTEGFDFAVGLAHRGLDFFFLPAERTVPVRRSGVRAGLRLAIVCVLQEP
jgi:hypothetical protein